LQRSVVQPLAVGYLQHAQSGLYVHPAGGVAAANVKLLLHPGAGEARLVFVLHADGNLQHQLSGLFVHPLGGRATADADLILHPGGHEPRLSLELTYDGCLRSRETGLFVHPRGGVGAANVPLLFHPGGGEARLHFRFVPVGAAGGAPMPMPAPSAVGASTFWGVPWLSAVPTCRLACADVSVS